MPSISGPEIIVVLVIALIVLGPRRLPEMAKSAGRGLREFRAGLSSDPDDHRDRALERERAEEREREDPGGVEPAAEPGEHTLTGRSDGGATA